MTVVSNRSGSGKEPFCHSVDKHKLTPEILDIRCLFVYELLSFLALNV